MEGSGWRTGGLEGGEERAMLSWDGMTQERRRDRQTETQIDRHVSRQTDKRTDRQKISEKKNESQSAQDDFSCGASVFFVMPLLIGYILHSLS